MLQKWIWPQFMLIKRIWTQFVDRSSIRVKALLLSTIYLYLMKKKKIGPPLWLCYFAQQSPIQVWAKIFKLKVNYGGMVCWQHLPGGQSYKTLKLSFCSPPPISILYSLFTLKYQCFCLRRLILYSNGFIV